ncbi:hypothetical protein J4455_04675 [Candidatus Woesearchaeota archaeon]|nr:hypothetical protein [Candidatus Woesearchaeota archaeon]
MALRKQTNDLMLQLSEQSQENFFRIMRIMEEAFRRYPHIQENDTLEKFTLMGIKRDIYICGTLHELSNQRIYTFNDRLGRMDIGDVFPLWPGESALAVYHRIESLNDETNKIFLTEIDWDSYLEILTIKDKRNIANN